MIAEWKEAIPDCHNGTLCYLIYHLEKKNFCWFRPRVGAAPCSRLFERARLKQVSLLAGFFIFLVDVCEMTELTGSRSR